MSVATETVDYAAILAKANGFCGICGEAFGADGVHFDHKIPLSKGGAHAQDNLQAVHPVCNLRKGSKLIDPERVTTRVKARRDECPEAPGAQAVRAVR
jgi:5-methylcytosine-specific restriction endonuclease McrA